MGCTMRLLSVCIGVLAAVTVLLGCSVSVCWGIKHGYNPETKKRLLAAGTCHLLTRLHRAHANLAEWSPTLSILLLAHTYCGTDLNLFVKICACSATFGKLLHAFALVVYPAGVHWEHIVGFA